MNRQFLVIAFAAVGLTAYGCGDDDTGDGTSTAATTGSPGATTGSPAGSTGSPASTSATTGGGGEGGSGSGGGGEGGAGGGGASAEAQAFCTQYAADCTFGAENHWADEAACLAGFDTDVDQQECYQEHLDNAMGDDGSVHCEHAAGNGICR